MKTNYSADGSCATERDKLLSHLQTASDTIRNWPDWKLKVIGPIFPEQRKVNLGSTQETKE